MQEHKGKRLCITGIATAGKSTLAKKLAEETGGIAVLLDDFREELASDDRYTKWVNFYVNQDQKTYYATRRADDQWKDLVAQSEALWPAFLEKIHSYADEKRPVIFECVNLLPHLIKRDLNFPTMVLVGSSYEETLERNTLDPRWGTEPEELELNSRAFFFIERPHYIEEAEKSGYEVFQVSEEAHVFALKILT